MKQISYKTVLAYLALVVSFLPASFAVFGLLFLGLDQIDENLYSASDAVTILGLTVTSGAVAFILIWKAAKHFSRPFTTDL